MRDGTQQMTVLDHAQLKFIANTEFVPQGLRGNLPAILACVATGRALGLADMTALRSIHIIDGKATFSAELMVQLVRRAGHSITGEVTEGSASVTGRRADNGDTMTATWTLAMAERAGLLGKSNWKKYPEAMLWARAASQLCRMLFADCFAGQTYTPEEIGEANTTEEGEPIVDGDPAAGTPFSYGYEDEQPDELERQENGHVAKISPAQAKKLNVLVGRLRTQGTIATADLYDALNKPQTLGEDGELHWSPLRDSLSKAEAHTLIDLLENVEAAAALEKTLLEYAESTGKTAMVEEAIAKHRGESLMAQHVVWLREQAARIPAAPA